MSFISPEFVIFFSLIVPIFYLTPQRQRWLLLLIASYGFYAFGSPFYLPLIMISTLVDYVAARGIAASEDTRIRQRWLFLSLSINLGLLFVFKYYNFFNDALGAGLGAIGLSSGLPTFELLLPVGISFYTFQSLSYTIDVYRGKLQPENHLGIMATFVAFFPQLVAGPIERATNLLPQFRQQQFWSDARVILGLRQMLWGFFKKVVIADRLAIYVNTVYNQPQDQPGQILILATVFFAFQIYCDFSGYSDIAIGAARILGYDLMQNFRQPYMARSVREFWARWHISLSTWFRDYVYIPLGGNRVSFRRNLLNLMIVFLVSGLWHGAGWTFLLWGALHGLFVVAEALAQRRGLRLLPQSAWLPRVLWTFSLICLTWIFFRANSIEDAFLILGGLLRFDPAADLSAPFREGLLGAQTEFLLSWGLIALLLLADFIDSQAQVTTLLRRSPLALRWALYYGAGAAVVFSGLYGLGAQQFIYFRF